VDKVFVIYGRDLAVRDSTLAMLTDFGLEVQGWEAIVRSTGSTLPFLLDVITRGISTSQAVVCVLTPDDITWLHPSLHDRHEFDYEVQPTMQARPNVLIELGIALGICRDRTVILHFGHLRPVADLAGLNVIRFDGTNAASAVQKIAERLTVSGCAVRPPGPACEYSFNELAAHARRPGAAGDPGRREG
jgi:predicted nucleotide-binding protein